MPLVPPPDYNQGQPPLVVPLPTVTNDTSDDGRVEQQLPPSVAAVTSTPTVDTVDVTINTTPGTSETTAASTTTATATVTTTSDKTPDGM